MSDASAGRGGYMQDRGLIPLPQAELDAQRQIARNQIVMQKPAK